jgi:hypothetical protein
MSLSPEDKYYFRDGKRYKCLSCNQEIDDRLSHIKEKHHNSYRSLK